MNLVQVTDSRYEDKLFVNVDAIAWIHPDSGQVCFTGVHGEGNGLRSFRKDQMDKIKAALGIEDGE